MHPCTNRTSSLGSRRSGPIGNWPDCHLRQVSYAGVALLKQPSHVTILRMLAAVGWFGWAVIKVDGVALAPRARFKPVLAVALCLVD